MSPGTKYIAVFPVEKNNSVQLAQYQRISRWGPAHFPEILSSSGVTEGSHGAYLSEKKNQWKNLFTSYT